MPDLEKQKSKEERAPQTAPMAPDDIVFSPALMSRLVERGEKWSFQREIGKV
jgi:hypothetical protein